MTVLLLCVSTAAWAQRGESDLVRESQMLTQEIQRNARYLSRAQAQAISGKFEEIRDILYGSGSSPVSQYSCVPRDNDGRAPYVFAIREGLNMRRIPGTTFGDLQDCDRAIRGIRDVGVAAVACIPRDNDGRAPWVMSLLESNGNLKRVQRSATNSFSECQSLVQRMRVVEYGRQALYCTARDNDARAPYQAVSLDLGTGSVQGGSETFSDINACWNFLGQ